MNEMGMMLTTCVDRHNMGMWLDSNTTGWADEEHGGRGGESIYGEEAVSDHQYGEQSHDRGGWPNAMKEKERWSERDWSGTSHRKYREPGYDRDVPREKEMAHHDHEWCIVMTEILVEIETKSVSEIIHNKTLPNLPTLTRLYMIKVMCTYSIA